MIGLNSYTIGGAIGALMASFAFGAYQGWSYEHDKFMAYKTEIALISERQNAKNESIQKQSDLINKGIQNEYEARLSAIRNHYANGVRPSSSGSMSPIPNSTFSIDGKATDIELACAYTTQQLISLQNWIKEQAGIK